MTDAVQKLAASLQTDIVQRLGEIDHIPGLVDQARAAGALNQVLEKTAQMARTVRRQAIAELCRNGHGPTEIANAVGVSVSTVKVIRDATRQRQ